MTFLSLNSNLATVAQGVILIGVVMFGSLVRDAAGAGVTGAQATVDGALLAARSAWLADCSATDRSCRCSACWSS